MTKCGGDCQAMRHGLTYCSEPILVPTSVVKFCWSLRNKGLRATLGIVWGRIARGTGRRRNGRAGRCTSSACSFPEVLDLQPGELVQVGAEQEVRETLDAEGTHRGLLWMPNMARFCGKRYRVYKRVETVMVESTGEIRRLKNTVLLEGVLCEHLYECDRSCFHFWREAWLRRPEGDRDVHDEVGHDCDTQRKA